MFLIWTFYFKGQTTFKNASQLGIHHGTFEIVIQETLWSIRDTYWSTWGVPLVNIQWHSEARPVTVSSQPIRPYTGFITLIPILTFTELREVSMAHLQRARHPIMIRLILWRPGSVTFGSCVFSHCWNYFPKTCLDCLDFCTSDIRWYFLSILPLSYCRKCVIIYIYLLHNIKSNVFLSYAIDTKIEKTRMHWYTNID